MKRFAVQAIGNEPKRSRTEVPAVSADDNRLIACNANLRPIVRLPSINWLVLPVYNFEQLNLGQPWELKYFYYEADLDSDSEDESANDVDTSVSYDADFSYIEKDIRILKDLNIYDEESNQHDELLGYNYFLCLRKSVRSFILYLANEISLYTHISGSSFVIDKQGFILIKKHTLKFVEQVYINNPQNYYHDFIADLIPKLADEEGFLNNYLINDNIYASFETMDIDGEQEKSRQQLNAILKIFGQIVLCVRHEQMESEGLGIDNDLSYYLARYVMDEKNYHPAVNRNNTEISMLRLLDKFSDYLQVAAELSKLENGEVLIPDQLYRMVNTFFRIFHLYIYENVSVGSAQDYNLPQLKNHSLNLSEVFNNLSTINMDLPNNNVELEGKLSQIFRLQSHVIEFQFMLFILQALNNMYVLQNLNLEFEQLLTNGAPLFAENRYALEMDLYCRKFQATIENHKRNFHLLSSNIETDVSSNHRHHATTLIYYYLVLENEMLQKFPKQFNDEDIEELIHNNENQILEREVDYLQALSERNISKENIHENFGLALLQFAISVQCLKNRIQHNSSIAVKAIFQLLTDVINAFKNAKKFEYPEYCIRILLDELHSLQGSVQTAVNTINPNLLAYEIQKLVGEVIKYAKVYNTDYASDLKYKRIQKYTEDSGNKENALLQNPYCMQSNFETVQTLFKQLQSNQLTDVTITRAHTKR